MSIYLIVFLALSVAILARSTKQNNNAPQATVVIESIVDKTTRQPITNNTVTLRWETVAGELIATEKYEDQTTLSTTPLADDRTKLWVTVEARGYKSWENAIRLKRQPPGAGAQRRTGRPKLPSRCASERVGRWRKMLVPGKRPALLKVMCGPLNAPGY